MEGESDKRFFELLCKDESLKITVDVLIPSDNDGTEGDGKGNLIQSLEMHIGEMRRTQYASIAAIVDADSIINDKKNGIEGTVHAFLNSLNSAQNADDGAYEKGTQNGNSVVFRHNNGFIDFHLWIMTNENGQEGIFEEWARPAVKAPDTLQEVFNTLCTLHEYPSRFKSIPKTALATWLAWHRLPQASLAPHMLNLTAPPMNHLIDWLKHIYQ